MTTQNGFVVVYFDLICLIRMKRDVEEIKNIDSERWKEREKLIRKGTL